MVGDLPGRDTAKVKTLAARENRIGDRLHLGGREDKNHVLRRFFQRLQQRVEGRRRKHVHLIDDINLVGALGRHVTHYLAQLADIFDAIVGCPVDLQHVHASGGGYTFAGIALFAGIRALASGAIERLRKDPRGGRFTHTARPTKQITLGNAPRVDGVFERGSDMVLSDHLVKLTRPPLARCYLIGHERSSE